MSAEAKKKAAEAKARADDAFKRKDYMAAVDAYTQVHFVCYVMNNSVFHQLGCLA